MYFDTQARIKLDKVSINDVYLDGKHGVDLRRAHDFATILRKNPGRMFEPLGCIRDKDGRFEVREGHHRLIAYQSRCFKDVWVVYQE